MSDFGDFDRQIEFELHRKLDSLERESIPLRRTVQSRATRTRALVGGAGAALAMKLVSGVAVAAAAVTVAGASATGSLDPTVWGQQVSQRVQQCQDTLADGKHGIGDCVSAFAKTHGPGVASDARHHGNGGTGNGNANGNGNGNANNGRDKDRPSPGAKSQGPAHSGDRDPSEPPGRPAVSLTPHP
jgi:hypothetical protein